MVNFKELVAQKISKILKQVDIEEIKNSIEVPPQREMGDFAFPCFKLSKILKKSPIIIATDLLKELDTDKYFSRIEQQSGYINFYLNNEILAKEVLTEIKKNNMELIIQEKEELFV